MQGNAVRKDLDLNDIVQTMKSSTSFAHLISNWYTLTLHLQTEDILRDSLALGLRLETTKPEQLLIKLLQDWKSKSAEKATIEELHRILKACTFNDVAQAIELKYLEPKGSKNGVTLDSTSKVNVPVPATCLKTPQWILSLPGTHKDVLVKLRSQFCGKMKDTVSNTKTVLEMMSLNYWDGDVMSSISLNINGNQTDRMNLFFEHISELDDTEILKCLELLCNLPEQPILSKRLRKLFEDNYPACLVLRDN